MTSPRLLLFACALGVGLSGTQADAEVRIITAPGVVAPRFDAPPSRVAPPSAPVKPAAPIVERKLGPVVVESGEMLRAGRLHVRLPGVVTVAADEICRDAAGTDWACGRRALLGLRAVLRLKPVVCPLPADARSGEVEAICVLLAGGEVGRLFVTSGWARAAAEGPYADDEVKARAEGRGIWAVAPDPTIPSAAPASAGAGSADGVPPDVTTAPLGGAEPRTAPLGGAEPKTAPLGGGGPSSSEAIRATAPAEGAAGAPLRLGR